MLNKEHTNWGEYVEIINNYRNFLKGMANFVVRFMAAGGQAPLADGSVYHDDVIKWKHFPSYWPFVRGIHRSPVNSTHKAPVTRSFDAELFFDLHLIRRLSKHSRGWWFETPPRSLWRQCNVHAIWGHFTNILLTWFDLNPSMDK